MFTIFHLFQVVGFVCGFFYGAYWGAKQFGWIVAICLSVIGGLLGLILGKLPFVVSFAFLQRQLRRSDVETLKRRLRAEPYIAHLIERELTRRGELQETAPTNIF